MAHNITQIQMFLVGQDIDIGPQGIDGRFGHGTLNGVNAYLKREGRAPFVGVPTLTEVNAALFPEEQPAPPSKPIRKPGLFDALAIILTLSKGKPMTWDTTQQLIRIALYAGGSYFLGQQVADGQLFQAAMAGLVPVGAFLWWLVFERNRPKA